jgi:O-antigen ligase
MMTAFASVRRMPEQWWVATAVVLIAGALILLPLPSAVAAIGGTLAMVAILRWHELALYALIVAVPFGSWFPIPLGVGNLTAVDLLVALLVALWIARMIVQERAIRIQFPPLSFAFALFLGAALLSATVTLSLQHTAKETVKWLEMFAIYLYVANNLNSAQIIRSLGVMFLAALAEAAIGIYQFVFGIGPEGFGLFGRFMRAYGTFEQPNPFAGYLGLIIPVALGMALTLAIFRDRGVDRRERLWELAVTGLAAGTLVALLAALLMSWSRGAWLGVGAALVVTVVVQSRRAFVVSAVAAFLLTFVLLLSSINVIPEAIAERFSGIGDYFGVFDVRGVKVDDANYAIVERMAHWQAAMEMFVDHPALGVGFGNYEVVYPAYALPRWSDPLGHAHNYYLNVAAEAGLVGLVTYLFLWGAALWQGWRAVRTLHGASRSLAAGLLGMIIALSIHNAFDNLFVHGMAVQVGIGLGILAALRKERMTEDARTMAA